MELVITGKGDQSAPSRTESKENLYSSSHPRLEKINPLDKSFLTHDTPSSSIVTELYITGLVIKQEVQYVYIYTHFTHKFNLNFPRSVGPCG